MRHDTIYGPLVSHVVCSWSWGKHMSLVKLQTCADHCSYFSSAGRNDVENKRPEDQCKDSQVCPDGIATVFPITCVCVTVYACMLCACSVWWPAYVCIPCLNICAVPVCVYTHANMFVCLYVHACVYGKKTEQRDLYWKSFGQILHPQYNPVRSLGLSACMNRSVWWRAHRDFSTSFLAKCGVHTHTQVFLWVCAVPKVGWGQSVPTDTSEGHLWGPGMLRHSHSRTTRLGRKGEKGESVLWLLLLISRGREGGVA